MALSREDKADVKASFGKKAANAVSKATRDKSSGYDKAFKKRDGMKKLKVKDEGYGNISHLAKTYKRGEARFGKGSGGVSHWSKDPRDKHKTSADY